MPQNINPQKAVFEDFLFTKIARQSVRKEMNSFWGENLHCWQALKANFFSPWSEIITKVIKSEKKFWLRPSFSYKSSHALSEVPVL